MSTFDKHRLCTFEDGPPVGFSCWHLNPAKDEDRGGFWSFERSANGIWSDAPTQTGEVTEYGPRAKDLVRLLGAEPAASVAYPSVAVAFDGKKFTVDIDGAAFTFPAKGGTADLSEKDCKTLLKAMGVN